MFNEAKRADDEQGAENLFCLDGRIMMGPKDKAWQPVLTAHLVGVPVGIFCVFECAPARPPASCPWPTQPGRHRAPPPAGGRRCRWPAG